MSDSNCLVDHRGAPCTCYGHGMSNAFQIENYIRKITALENMVNTLQEQIKSLESQLTDLKSLLHIQNDQITELQSKLLEVTKQLAQERDRFGKRETELMAQLKAADESLRAADALAKAVQRLEKNEVIDIDLQIALDVYEKTRKGK